MKTKCMIFYLDWNRSQYIHTAQRARRVSSLLAGAAKDQRREQNVPSVFRAALRVCMEDLAAKVKSARKRVKDDETSVLEVERGRR